MVGHIVAADIKRHMGFVEAFQALLVQAFLAFVMAFLAFVKAFQVDHIQAFVVPFLAFIEAFVDHMLELLVQLAAFLVDHIPLVVAASYPLVDLASFP